MSLLMDLKVVKVGDIDAPPEERYLLPDTSTSESNEIILDQFNWRPTSQLSVCSGGWNVYHNDDLVKPVSEELELPEDGGAPDNWPQIPQLSRRRSCEASGERTNCVNKAVEHLQLLLDILNNCVQQTEDKVSKDTDVDQKLSSFDRKDKEGALVPLTTDLVPFRNIKALKSYTNHAQLKAVVKEVMLLLAWLHDDCQKTEAKLYSEKVLESQISSKVDEMSRQKIIDLKNGVQKEHDIMKAKIDPCLEPIKQLYRTREKLQNKLKPVQKINFQLKKDINNKKEQILPMQQKILHENQKIDDLQNALNEVEETRSETLKRKAAAYSKYEEAQKILKKEQYSLDVKVNAICHEFNVVSQAAVKAEKSYYTMINGIVDSKEQIDDNEKEMMTLKVKLENRKTQSNTMEIESHEEKRSLMNNAKEIKHLKRKNNKFEEEIIKKKNEFSVKKAEKDEERLRLDQEFKSLLDFNHVKSNEIDNMHLQLDTCQKQKTFYEVNQKQMINDIMSTESQVTVSSDELNRNQGENEVLNEREEQRQLKIVEQEKYLASIVKDIKKEIDSENNTYLELSGMVTDIELEMRSNQVDANQEKDKYQTSVDDTETTLEKQNYKLEKLNTLKEQKEEELAGLKGEQIILVENYKKAIQDKEDYLSNLVPFQKISERKGRDLEWKILKMKHEEGRLRTGMNSMIDKGVTLEAAMIKANEENEQLKEEIQVYSLPTKVAYKHYLDAKARWCQVDTRCTQERKDHYDLMQCRKETLEDILQKKQQSLEENEQLASKYRTAQTTLMQKKKEYVQLLEKTILLNRSINDLIQLLKLQMRMQNYQKHYYQYRDLYHSKQLAYFVNVSEGSQNKIILVQSEFHSKIKRLANCLNEVISTVFPRRPSFLPEITDPTF